MVGGYVVIQLTVPGVPRGKGRPRFVKASGRTYTDKQTVNTEQQIAAAWAEAGAVRMPDEALTLHVMAVFERPKAHWKKSGPLTHIGEVMPWPTKRPDMDNIYKIVLDALNGLAYKDDCQVVHSVLWKRWANPGEEAHVKITVDRVGRFG